MEKDASNSANYGPIALPSHARLMGMWVNGRIMHFIEKRGGDG